MKIRLTQQIRLRSEELPAGAELDADEIDAQQLIQAGHAEAVPAPIVTPSKKTEQE